jgi:hypothetical protein
VTLTGSAGKSSGNLLAEDDAPAAGARFELADTERLDLELEH